MEILRIKYVDLSEVETGQEAVAVEVKPLDELWLLSPERNWEEADMVLEGWVEGHQRRLTSNIEIPPGDNLSRLLAYCELMDEYRLVQHLYGEKRKQTSGQYQQAKDQLRSQGFKPSKYQRLIQAKWSQEYEPEIIRLDQRVERARRVEDLILAKAVLDMFSLSGNHTATGEPLVLQQLPRLLEMQKDFSLKEPDQVDYFLARMTDYLATTQSGSLFRSFSYRVHPQLVTDQEDCAVLSEVFDFMYREGQAHDADKRLWNLGHSLITFLKNRSDYLSDTKLADDYPRLSLVYDLLASAIWGNRAVVASDIHNLIDRHFLPSVRSNNFQQEIQELARRLAQKRNLLVATVAPKIAKSMMGIEHDSFADDAAITLISPEFRILAILPYYNKLVDIDVVILQPSETIGMVGNQLLKAGKINLEEFKLVRKFERLQAADLFVLTLGACGTVFFPDSDDAFLNLLQKDFENPRSESLSQQELDDRLRQFRIIQNEVAASGSKLGSKEIVKGFLAAFFGENLQEPKEVDAENSSLWDEVLDDSVWFVSPRGDRFSVAHDTELSLHGISSITFGIDRSKPRSHLVAVRVQGADIPLKFWLGSDRRLHHEDGDAVLFDPLIQMGFINLVLRRLYTVTSGQLSQEIQEAHGDGEPGFITEYRRAHYRILASTEGRKITMESRGAHVHAKEILETYGIGIYKETARRRALGRIKPYQFLTFVREVSPQLKGALVLPNELQYNPDQVRFPF